MDPVKRNTILKEIEYWRRSKLLPEQYCDFLRNLYVEHSEIGTSVKAEHAPWSKRISFQTICYLLGGLITLLLFVTYFTSFHPALQTAISIFLISMLLANGLLRRKSNPAISMTMLSLGSLLSLFLGTIMIRLNGMEEPYWTVALVAVCGALWIAIGIVGRFGLLHFTGWFAVSLGLLWLIQQLHSSPGWLVFQVYTVPITAILAIAGRAINKGMGSAGSLFIISATLFFILPEGFGLLFLENSHTAWVFALIIKVGIIGIAGWKLRQQKKPITELFANHDEGI